VLRTKVPEPFPSSSSCSGRAPLRPPICRFRLGNESLQGGSLAVVGQSPELSPPWWPTCDRPGAPHRGVGRRRLGRRRRRAPPAVRRDVLPATTARMSKKHSPRPPCNSIRSFSWRSRPRRSLSPSGSRVGCPHADLEHASRPPRGTGGRLLEGSLLSSASRSPRWLHRLGDRRSPRCAPRLGPAGDPKASRRSSRGRLSARDPQERPRSRLSDCRPIPSPSSWSTSLRPRRAVQDPLRHEKPMSEKRGGGSSSLPSAFGRRTSRRCSRSSRDPIQADPGRVRRLRHRPGATMSGSWPAATASKLVVPATAQPLQILMVKSGDQALARLPSCGPDTQLPPRSPTTTSVCREASSGLQEELVDLVTRREVLLIQARASSSDEVDEGQAPDQIKSLKTREFSPRVGRRPAPPGFQRRGHPEEDRPLFADTKKLLLQHLDRPPSTSVRRHPPRQAVRRRRPGQPRPPVRPRRRRSPPPRPPPVATPPGMTPVVLASAPSLPA